MERLGLTLLLCLSLLSVLQGEIVDLTGVPFNPILEADCCQPSDVITQPIGGDADCTVETRGCEFGCSRCSNHTGSVSLGSSAADIKPVCPAETSMEEEVCCTPAQTQKRWKYCKGRWYSYEYPITCSCGPCEYLPTNTLCKLTERQSILTFYIDQFRCVTRDEIPRRTCGGYCTSTEHNYIIVMFNSKIPVYRKNCQCCYADTYEILNDIKIACSSAFFGDQFLVLTTDIQVIKTCDCEWCHSKPFGVQQIEDDVIANEEPVISIADSVPTIEF